MNDSTTAKPRVPVTDPACVPTIWANHLASIEIQGPVAVLTFTQSFGRGDDEQRRVCARVAVETALLPGMARRITGLKAQIEALKRPAGSA